MRYGILTLFAILFIASIWGCDSTGDTTYKGDVSGYVKDSTSGLIIPSVKVTVYPGTIAVYTDTAGYFLAKDIYLPSSAGNITLTFEHSSYVTKVITTVIKHNIVNVIDTVKLVPVTDSK